MVISKALLGFSVPDHLASMTAHYNPYREVALSGDVDCAPNASLGPTLTVNATPDPDPIPRPNPQPRPLPLLLTHVQTRIPAPHPNPISAHNPSTNPHPAPSLVAARHSHTDLLSAMSGFAIERWEAHAIRVRVRL